MKKYLFFVAALVALASCSDDNFVGNNSPNQGGENGDGGAINFGLSMQNVTRGDIYGKTAADKLGNAFYVMGTKGEETESAPSSTVVFDNYLVHYGINTAGTTASNTANWEYVGVTPGSGSYTNWVKTGSYSAQSIKYWDYSQPQYDFLAFSTGTFKAVVGSSTDADNIGISAIAHGSALSGTAYTFDVPSIDALENIYVTDITPVVNSNYGKEVKLTFKSLASKVRIGLYETVPGYSVKDVKFYTVDGTSSFSDDKGTAANLISTDNASFASTGTIIIRYPNIGTDNKTTNGNYNKAAATVSPTAGDTKKAFGNLFNFAVAEGTETSGNYLGRSLPAATFAGSADADYYQKVFPVSASYPLTLRLDYTLVSTDGSGEEIKVYGAKAVVPATYTVWQPNYAYTFIFKISDNTNGWTTQTGTTTSNQGLYPVTFDAVVTEFTDVSGEQTTITTVAAPTITTYQQNHNPLKPQDEYARSTAKDVYVQVMNNTAVPATLYENLNEDVPGASTKRSRLYKVTTEGAAISEATVMDALENRNTLLSVANVTGRNGITLTNNTNIDPAVTSIVNGADDNPITVAAGKAAKIAITASGFETGQYAYVYDYSESAKSETTIYQPFTATGTYLPIGTKYITKVQLDAITDVTVKNEAVDYAYIYFSKTTDGTGTDTYSYVSVDSKEKLPAGLLKFAASNLKTASGTSDPVSPTTLVSSAAFAFKVYYKNHGSYAVKVINVE